MEPVIFKLPATPAEKLGTEFSRQHFLAAFSFPLLAVVGLFSAYGQQIQEKYGAWVLFGAITTLILLSGGGRISGLEEASTK